MSEGTAPLVVIVGDEEPLVDQFATWLRGTYRVETVTDPRAAAADLPDDIRVVLLDQKFASPQGSIALERTATRVGLVLSYEPDWDVIKTGYDGYVTKPVTRGDVCNLVDRLVKRSQYEDRLERYFELVSEQATVTAVGAPDDIGGRKEVASMEREIADVQTELQELLDSFDPQDYVAVFRDISSKGDRS